ncbi:hypothetical protein WT26_07135 [Burkholderia cepacia]|uniref:Uncharacterized protein n=1 Tax=Burkholderia cepacia TaxID=292 RepID=A0A1B4PPE7_BURCE|nr:hypothetical protein WT26_07135 [Burkholderia cepacia]
MLKAIAGVVIGVVFLVIAAFTAWSTRDFLRTAIAVPGEPQWEQEKCLVQKFISSPVVLWKVTLFTWLLSLKMSIRLNTRIRE